MKTLNKTKAALQSRLCRTDVYQLDVQDNTVIVLVNTEAGFLALVTGIPILPDTHNLGIELLICNSDNCMIGKQSVKMRFRYASLQHTPEKTGGHSFESAARCFFWRRLISPSSAETTNCPILSSACLKLSTSAAIERGTLTSNLFDFVLIDFVAIAELPFKWCPTIIIEKKVVAKLDVSDTYKYALSDTSGFPQVQKQRNPEVFAALTGSLTKTLTGVTNMAEQQHTQTRSKFTWRFLAVGESTPEMRPVILYTNATTEKEARDNCPGWVLYFAARFPLHVPEIQGVRHA